MLCFLRRACPCLPPTSVFKHEGYPTLVNIGWYPKVPFCNMLGEQPHYSIPGEAQNNKKAKNIREIYHLLHKPGLQTIYLKRTKNNHHIGGSQPVCGHSAVIAIYTVDISRMAKTDGFWPCALASFVLLG